MLDPYQKMSLINIYSGNTVLDTNKNVYRKKDQQD